MRVLLVSRSHADEAYLHKALRESAHSLQATHDLHDARYVASLDAFDAIVIVALEPDAVATLCALLPEFGRLPGMPAIFVVLAQATAPERACILRAGADACLVQPYSFIELHERMVALHRLAAREAGAGDGAASMSLRLDALTHELVEDGKRVTATSREYLLVECLLRQANSPVARDQLIRYAWPDRDDVDPSSVNLLVSRLRRKLAGKSFAAQIETVSRYGYRLTTSSATR